MFPRKRMRRLRASGKLRGMVNETRLGRNDLVYPIFVDENAEQRKEIKAMPGQYRLPLEKLGEEARDLVSLGIPATILFGIPRRKDDSASEAYNPRGIVPRAIEKIKGEVGEELVVITDVCLCEYTSHGHCGVVEEGEIKNDPTLELLAKEALAHAEAGCDMVAPSDMMDGRVGHIRDYLDDADFKNTAIMSYAAKYASSFYGPFRHAAESSPTFGDRRSYQMNYSNAEEALREVKLDIEEGADIVMVKPALGYLDIVRRVKEKFGFPTAAYNVSGEYSTVKAAAKLGYLDERAVALELLTSIKRAGADIILTYHAKDAAKWLEESE